MLLTLGIGIVIGFGACCVLIYLLLRGDPLTLARVVGGEVTMVRAGWLRMGQVGTWARQRTEYYAMLRNGTLMIYTDDSRHTLHAAVALADVFVVLEAAEHECFSRTLPIVLQGAVRHELYFQTSLDKERWYFALRRHSKSGAHDTETPPHFGDNWVRLQQQITPAHELSWFNALVGRVFLGVHSHPVFLDAVLARIARRLSKIRTPLGCVEAVVLSCGNQPPIVSSPQLLYNDASSGQIDFELDLKYAGECAFAISLNRLSVQMCVRVLSGRVRVHMEPPPSVRVWFAFTRMPHFDCHIDSARPLADLLKSRVALLLQNTLVLPHMEDISFISMHDGGLFFAKPHSEYSDASTFVDNSQVCGRFV